MRVRATLFTVLGSAVVELPEAPSKIAPAWITFAVSWTVADAAAASVPREQVTDAAPEQVPALGVTETNRSDGGRLSLTFTPAAASGPALCAVIVRTTSAPT